MAAVAENTSSKPSSGGYIATVVLAALVVALGYLFWQAPTDRQRLSGSGAGSSALGFELAPKTRCEAPEGSSARIGETAAVTDDDAPEAAPYAAEVGRAAALAEGFALGAKRHLESNAVAEVVLLGADGALLESVPLGPLRGDGDAPLVVALPGGGWVAALLEPNASGWALRLAWREDGELHWGAEIDQGRDESLAFDLVYGERIGVAVWDDIDRGEKISVVKLARVARDGHQLVGKSKVVSGAVEAEVPRLARREGGFWLAYVARALTPSDEEHDGEGGDARYRAEQIRPAWIELLPLDADGLPQGAPTPLTPKDGYVQTFDLATAGNGEDALLAWREDDTPSGAEGGRVLIMQVTPSGGAHTQVVAQEDVGAGVPQLLRGWLAVSDVRGGARLVPLDERGQPRGEMLLETALGRAQPIGARAVAGDGALSTLLMARPYGRAMDIPVARCDAARYPANAPAASSAAAAPSASPSAAELPAPQ